MHIPLEILLIPLINILITRAGNGDTYDDMKVACGNLNFTHSYVQVPVETILKGNVPHDLSGTFVRHGCGAFGNAATKIQDDVLDKVENIIDCISIDQSFSFHNGQAYFSSQFYDSNIARIFRDIYNEDMHESSIYWETILGRQNDTAIDLMVEEMYAPGRPSRVSAVSWWHVGTDVYAMAEWKDGNKVSQFSEELINAIPHNC